VDKKSRIIKSRLDEITSIKLLIEIYNNNNNILEEKKKLNPK
jgi:hypothetical protein